ncbi:alpha/beta fold hydrolase [Bacillus sp. NPDC077027]|uniref:alpha/beta fold hydrolase n=1 Tax=Bacillus sp. NPDC077027 TaxID=3390548 RepID=UPI003CFBF03D
MEKPIFKKWNIGGIDQWIMINKNQTHYEKPILLFLHGGPGTAQISYIDLFHQELDKYFTMVNWDQRGAGLSYHEDIPLTSMNINQFIEDTIELSEKLLAFYGQSKLYLVGYSWGSLLGIQAVKRRPDLYYAYYGISQVVNVQQEDVISYELLLDRIKTKRLFTACMRMLTPPPWKRTYSHALFYMFKEFANVGLTHKWKPFVQLISGFICSTHYGWKDKLKFLKGQKFSQRALWKELMQESIQNRVSSILIPCYFLIGKHDLITPQAISKPYFQQLTAPIKEWFTFEKSAHSPHIEEPQKYMSILRKTATYHLK